VLALHPQFFLLPCDLILNDLDRSFTTKFTIDTRASVIQEEYGDIIDLMQVFGLE
jgi:hypothetical protein